MKKSTFVVALVAGVFSVFADEPSVTRIFREARPTRGNTNILKVQPIDDAKWVWLKGDGGRGVAFLKFRNEFEVKEGEGKLTNGMGGILDMLDSLLFAPFVLLEMMGG